MDSAEIVYAISTGTNTTKDEKMKLLRDYIHGIKRNEVIKEAEIIIKKMKDSISEDQE